MLKMDRHERVADFQVRKLPIGIQKYRPIREEPYYYVDKTDYEEDRLVDLKGKHYWSVCGHAVFEQEPVSRYAQGTDSRATSLCLMSWLYHDSVKGHLNKCAHPVKRINFGRVNFNVPRNLHYFSIAQLGTVEKVHSCVHRTGLLPAFAADDASTDRPAGRGANSPSTTSP